MQLTSTITILPVLHGRLAFAQHVRKMYLEKRYECVAIDLPPQFQDDVITGVDRLPYISAVTAGGIDGPVYYVPTDPCDAIIEGVRQSRQNRCACEFIGTPQLRKPQPLPPMPDDHAIASVGFEAYASLCLLALGDAPAGSPDDESAQHTAFMLHRLEASHRSILALVHLRRYTAIIRRFREERSYNTGGQSESASRPPTRTLLINPDHLYFALGELPFITGKSESIRQDPFASEFNPPDGIKELFRETRDGYYDTPEEISTLSPARIQAALTFVRNLTVMSGRLMPDLFDIIAAAKGVGGNAYAVRMLKSARYYPFLPLEISEPFLSVGIDRISFPEDSSPRDAVNLLRDTALVWKRLSIKPDPSLEKKKNFRYRWNPSGMCSHLPEDRRIESFNAHIRKKTVRILAEDHIKTEKFTTSVKDGIDIRETLRNWHTGGIYVKDLPPQRGSVDTVVIIFDQDHDRLYTHCATWYAEHTDESTLTFYATDPFARMIGPGVAQSRYGGLALLFPPRPIPDIFELTQGMTFGSLAQQLTYGAMLFSKEKNIAYISARKPDIRTRQMARHEKKHLVWIPISSFSNETLRRLQKFHVLNGKTVRSWAARFIGD